MKNLLNKLNAKKNNKGFTLVELIIVIAIIAILTVVLAPQYTKYVDKSRWATDQDEAATLLSEVQVAVVEAGVENTAILTTGSTSGTIVMSSTGVVANNIDGAFTTLLGSADANWNKVKVDNKGQAAGSDAHTTYTITITDAGAVTGAWS